MTDVQGHLDPKAPAQETGTQRAPNGRSKRFYGYSAARATIIILGATLASTAAAQAGPLQPLVTFICGISNALTGPIAWAIAIGVIAVGGLSLAVGGKRAISTLLWGAAGVFVALSAVQILTAMMPAAFPC